MFSHVMLGCDDPSASSRFYDTILTMLGIAAGTADDKGRIIYATPLGVLALTRPLNGGPASHGNGSTIGFRAGSVDQVRAWYAAGLIAGGSSCEDPPGFRTNAIGRLYLAYLRDPTGNKLCCSFRESA